MTGDQITALIGLVLALILVGRGGVFRKLGKRRALMFGAVWAVILGVVAVLWITLSGGLSLT